MSKTLILCHVVFSTKWREMTIEPSRKRDLYYYIFGIINNKKCTALRIGGIENHIHLLVDLHPCMALADLVKAIKQSSSIWIRDNKLFPYFNGWSSGYYAASVGLEGKEACINYITNQEEHHKRVPYLDELRHEIERHGLAWVDVEW